MKKWLVNQFLPMWAKQTVLQDLKQANQEIVLLKQKNRELQACISGIRMALRYMRRKGEIHEDL